MSVTFSEAWYSFRRSRLGMTGLALLLIFILMAVLAPILAPTNPDPLNVVGAGYAAPEWLGPVDPNFFPNTQLLDDPSFDSPGAWSFTAGSAMVSGGMTSSSFAIELADADDTRGGRPASFVETWFAWDRSVFPADTWMSYRIWGKASGDYATDDLKLSVAIAPEGYTQLSFMLKVLEGDVLIQPSQVKEFGVVLVTLSSVPDEPTVFERRIDILERTAFFREGSRNRLRFVVEFDVSADKMGSLQVFFDDVELLVFSNYYGILGTSDTGADAWSQLVWGSQLSLLVGLAATLISVFIGVMVGLSAGYYGGASDELLMRIVDFLLVIPLLPLLIVLAAFLGATIWNIILILAIFGWLTTSRLIRSQVLSEKAKAYVEAARAAGAGDVYIIIRHILPNVLPLIFVQLSLGVTVAIQLEAALSFIGLGPAQVVTWGKMLQFAFETGALSIGAWWYVIPPGVGIALLSMAFVFIGTTLDTILNPRLRRR
ncbi:MAG: ABC transporter permease [Thermoplasmata archaeon]